jgi:phage shock protein PspC (stress-responsive transcriptional regulator)
MKLSDAQNQRITAYLREVDAALGEHPDGERHEFVARLRASVQRSLEGTGNPVIVDEDIDRILKRLGTPDRQAARLARKYQQPEPEPAPQEIPADAVWLGVCQRLAGKVDLSPRLLRTLLVILGLLLPLTPFLLVGYMVAYLILRNESDADIPGPDLPKLLRRTGLLLAGCLALHIAAVFLVGLCDRLVWRLTEQTVTLEGGWGWLGHNRGALLFWTLLFTLAPAALSAFPVTPKWSETLFKTAQAVVATFAFLLCFGLGCHIAGTLLELADLIQISTELPSIL